MESQENLAQMAVIQMRKEKNVWDALYLYGRQEEWQLFIIVKAVIR